MHMNTIRQPQEICSAVEHGLNRSNADKHLYIHIHYVECERHGLCEQTHKILTYLKCRGM